MSSLATMPLLARFELQHKKSSDCWEWVGHIGIHGYGQIKDHYKTRHAHRVSYELYRGEIPKGLSVCHTCDNRKCVNPDHLFVGTTKDNIRDAMRKGRHPAGEKHNKAKLTWALVDEIRASNQDARIVAKRLGVAFSTIYRVRRMDLWNRRQGS